MRLILALQLARLEEVPAVVEHVTALAHREHESGPPLETLFELRQCVLGVKCLRRRHASLNLLVDLISLEPECFLLFLTRHWPGKPAQ